MKKFLSIALALVMMMSLCVPVFASTDYTNGTTVSYVNPNAEEAWEVTVPAAMAPGETATVTASGTFDSKHKLMVDADDTVTLVNSLQKIDTKTLNVTFEGITLFGSNTNAVEKSADISVENISDALFGTWSGTITYTAQLGRVPE